MFTAVGILYKTIHWNELSDLRNALRNQRNTILRRPRRDCSCVVPIPHVYSECSLFHDQCMRHHPTKFVRCFLGMHCRCSNRHVYTNDTFISLNLNLSALIFYLFPPDLLLFIHINWYTLKQHTKILYQNLHQMECSSIRCTFLVPEIFKHS